MLEIHDYNGQRAIEAARLMTEFRAIVLEGRQAMRALGRTAVSCTARSLRRTAPVR